MPFFQRLFRLVITRLFWLLLSLPLGFALRADEFQDLSDGFGTTLTLAGMPQSTTSNPDGTAIDFWTNTFEGALASTVTLSNPHMAAADAYGNVYIADKASHSILKITTDGRIHTFAGTHEAGFNGDGPAPATSLQLSYPNGLYVLPDGTVYLLDPGNHRIRRVALDGTMATVVNDPDPNWYPSGRALWVSPDQDLIYYTYEFAPVPPSILTDGATVKKWTPSGGIEVVCSKEVGFVNPGNIAVNPVDGKLYVTDRAEDDSTKMATGLFRIDGPDERTRMTGNINQPLAADGQLAVNSYIDQTRGIAFRADGSYFLCSHKEGNVWFVDTSGLLHKYLQGSGHRDGYSLPDGEHPPLVDQDYFAQPRALTLAPNGNLIVICNDSGFVFRVNSVAPLDPVTDFRLEALGESGARLTWTGVFGHGYRVERSDDLGNSSWQPVGAVAGRPAGTPTEFRDPTPTTQPAAFYRLLPSL
jgi:DNA-binding beta-propeller fold protein YncE